MKRRIHANSLANLKSWKPGQSGNPSGKPAGTVYPTNLINGLLALHPDGSPKHTQADIQSIVDSPDSPPVMVIAARWVIDSMRCGERWVAGKGGELKPAALDPTPLRARESLSDRIEGKPIARVDVQHTEVLDPDVAKLRLIETFANLPDEVRAALLETAEVRNMLPDNLHSAI